uniref:glutathione peroxidase 3-like n=1 Tax=Styela clava TaxID=7725 RepID=UPI00193AA6EA|nr:glutathione peroxidase 3-like [Styela clava]
MTSTQLEGQNALLEKFNNRNVITVGFPCNQFGMQEPGRPNEILNCYKYVRPGKGWTPNSQFKIMDKIDVNGDNEHPLFTFLKDTCPPVKSKIGSKDGIYWSPIVIGDITWNFGKFLIDKTGKPRYRFAPGVSPISIESYINELLAEDTPT